MSDLPTRTELFERVKAATLATPNTRISPKEIDREGSDANLLAAAASLMGEEIVTRAAQELAGCFEDTATGTKLDRVVFDRKQLPRKPATPAVVGLTLTRPTFALGAGNIVGGLPGQTPPPTRIQTNGGIVYILTQSAVFGPTSLGPVNVTAQAELAGLASEVEANQDWSFIDPIFDDSVIVSNPLPSAGAADQESDLAYRARAKNFFPTIRRGTKGAIDFGLQSVPGVASESIFEFTNPDGLPAGIVTGFILDELNQSNPTLAAIGLLSLLEYRAFGIPVILLSGTPLFVSIALFVEYDTSVVNDTVSAQNAVRAAVVAALNNQQPGKTLYTSTIIAAAKSVPGVVVPGNALVVPTGDIVPLTSDVTFRTRLEFISFL